MGRIHTIPVSVYIITLNEADKIRPLLNQLQIFSEVIVVDCGSTDATAEIAREFSNVRFYHRDWPGYCEQKAFALSLCNSEWALNIDADEELTEAYLNEVRRTIQDPDCVALESPRIEYRFGRRPSSLSRNQRLIRLFRKNHGYYKPCRVHERITVTGSIRQSSAPIIHHQNLTRQEMVAKLDRYSELKALDKFDNGCTANIFIMLLIFPWTFIQHYLFRRYLFNGSDGLIKSLDLARYNYNKFARLAELQKEAANGVSLGTIVPSEPASFTLNVPAKNEL